MDSSLKASHQKASPFVSSPKVNYNYKQSPVLINPLDYKKNSFELRTLTFAEEINGKKNIASLEKFDVTTNGSSHFEKNLSSATDHSLELTSDNFKTSVLSSVKLDCKQLTEKVPIGKCGITRSSNSELVHSFTIQKFNAIKIIGHGKRAKKQISKQKSSKKAWTHHQSPAFFQDFEDICNKVCTNRKLSVERNEWSENNNNNPLEVSVNYMQNNCSEK